METISNEERRVRIDRLLELIEGLNELVEAHRQAAAPSQSMINQYLETKEGFVAELSELLAGYGVKVIGTVDRAA